MKIYYISNTRTVEIKIPKLNPNVVYGALPLLTAFNSAAVGAANGYVKFFEGTAGLSVDVIADFIANIPTHAAYHLMTGTPFTLGCHNNLVFFTQQFAHYYK